MFIWQNNMFISLKFLCNNIRQRGVNLMGTVIIFALVTILAAFALISSFKNKNLLGILFAFGTFAVFGWFSVMTILNSGFPAVH
jgi:hypothetical protein